MAERPKINIEILKEQVGKYAINQNTATEFHRQLFTLHPETAELFDCEGIDPDRLNKSRKICQIGAGIIRQIFQLVHEYDNEQNWRASMKTLIAEHKEYNVNLTEFKKGASAVIAMMAEKCGGCTDEQKEAWNKLFEVCYKEMEALGYK